MREVAITAVGSDRPGIVAAISETLLGLGGNLEDCRAALLRGSFAIVVVAAVPDDVGEDDVRAALAPVARDLGLGVWVGTAVPPAQRPPGERCVISVYGADHPGIVAGVTRALADWGVNVLDLSSRLVGDPPVYVLGLEVELPPGLTSGQLERKLGPVARGQGLELSLESESDEVL